MLFTHSNEESRAIEQGPGQEDAGALTRSFI